MKKTADDIRSRISEMVTLFGFEYKGKNGYVDPCYDFQKKQPHMILFFVDNPEDVIVHDVDSVMSTPFVDGKTLTEVANEIEITEW